QYQPSSSAGRRLIGHELAHVLQARESRRVIMRQAQGEVNKKSLEYLRGLNDGRANSPSAPGPLTIEALADYDAGDSGGLAEATRAGQSLTPVTVAPEVEPPLPGLGSRLEVIEESGPAAQARLGEIIRNGGPAPQKTKVVGAAIIDVEGYQGPREM